MFPLLAYFPFALAHIARLSPDCLEMDPPRSRSIFAAVYVVSACGFALDVYLIAQLPQGFRLTQSIATDLLMSAITTGCAVWLVTRRHHRPAIACFALANLFALKNVNLIAHLAPAYIGRNCDFIDDALIWSDRLLGFDWVSYFMWHVEHPAFALICRGLI
jgi:hypothetical protein